MALSMSSGLIVACIMTLLLLPALFAITNDLRRILGRLRTGAWASREDVEPARNRAVDRYDEDLKKAASIEPAMVK
jgi:hypothetical protein